MGCARARDDKVDRVERSASPVCVVDCDVRPGRECGSRLLGERRVDLDSGDLAGRADKLGSNGGVVSGAAAKMQRILTCYYADLVKKIGPRLGWPLLIPRASSSAISTS